MAGYGKKLNYPLSDTPSGLRQGYVVADPAGKATIEMVAPGNRGGHFFVLSDAAAWDKNTSSCEAVNLPEPALPVQTGKGRVDCQHDRAGLHRSEQTLSERRLSA